MTAQDDAGGAGNTGTAQPSEETYRGTLDGRTANGSRATIIVTRQGLGRAGRVWLTFLGAIKTTQVMTDDETDRLVELLQAARSARQPHRPA